MKTDSKVKSDTKVIDRATHNGPSAEQWDIMGAKATLTLTTEISKLSSLGNFKVDSKSKEIGSLDLLALADANSHKDNVGGEDAMLTKVAKMFLSIPFADSVYYYKINGEDHYTIIFQDDSDDLSDQIADVQMDAYDVYPEAYFEVRYILHKRFNPESIPTNAKRISNEE